MKSLNTPIEKEIYINLVFDFKKWYNKHNKKKLFLLNHKLYGKHKEFKNWLFYAKDITDLKKYLKDKKKTFNRFNYYKSKAKYNNNYSYN